jgi:hypothetical protein
MKLEQRGGRPSRMEETAYLARLFIVHLYNSLAEKSAHRRQRWGDFSYSSLPTPLLPLPKSRDQVVGQHIKVEERSDWLGGKPWGHSGQV